MGIFAGKIGLVMGVANDRSIAWAMSESLYAEGAELAFTHLPGPSGQRRIMKLVESRGPKLVLPCDVQHDEDIAHVFEAIGAAYGYGYNLLLSAPLGQPPVNIGKAARPAMTALLADAAQVNTFQYPASADHPMLEEFYYVTTNEATVHFRHSQQANLLFCDGHVEREKPAPNSLDTRLPSQCIGWLKSEILLPR